MSPDEPMRRHGDHWYHITPWRAAIIGAWLVLIVVSIRGEVNTSRIDHQQARTDTIATNGRTGLCVVVNFLENTRKVTVQAMANDPGNPMNPQREQSVKRLTKLIDDMRTAIPGCPPLE